VITRWAFFVALLSSSAVCHGASIDPQEDVLNRPHSEYDQIGIRTGGFTLLPSISSQLSATDNYRATPDNPDFDVSLLLTPDLTWKSNWSRHRISGRVFLQQSINAPLHDENFTSFGANANGLYDISANSQLQISAEAARLAEDHKSLRSFRDTIGPTLYDLLNGRATYAHVFDRLELQANGELEHRTYHEAVLVNGFHVSQHFRDLQMLSFSGHGEYDLGNGIGVVVTAEHDDIRYDFRPGSRGFINGFTLDRDSSGVNLEAGISLELTNLIFGTIQAGYLHRNYADERMTDVSGPSFDADVLWSITPLTSIEVSGKHYIEESGSTNFAGNIRTDVGLKVHHELYRNVVLRSELAYGHFEPVIGGASGNEYSMLLGARYRMNRRVTLNAQIQYSRRDASVENLRYHATTANLGLRYGL